MLNEGCERVHCLTIIDDAGALFELRKRLRTPTRLAVGARLTDCLKYIRDRADARFDRDCGASEAERKRVKTGVGYAGGDVEHPSYEQVCYSDTGHAEDLAQSSLIKTYLAWGRLRDPANAEAYARRTLVRLALRARQRRWTAEIASGRTPAAASAPVRRWWSLSMLWMAACSPLRPLPFGFPRLAIPSETFFRLAVIGVTILEMVWAV